MSDNRLLGAESLSRFSATPQRSPDQWFAEAGEVGLKTALELKAIRKSLVSYKETWRYGALHLGLNSSAQTIVDGGLLKILGDCPAEQIVLEITEHDQVENYDELHRAVAPLRKRGVKIAVDDAGSGYASMRHILNLSPDVIKLDVSLTRGMDADRMRRALASALIEFADQTGCKIVAEGIETEAELQTLRNLGVHAGQGYYLSRPISIGEFRRLQR